MPTDDAIRKAIKPDMSLRDLCDHVSGKAPRSPVRKVAAKAASKPKTPRLPTYALAKEALFTAFEQEGWNIRRGLKTPYATSPDGEVRFWFKPRGIWMSQSLAGQHSLAHARSTRLDIRSPSTFQALIRLTKPPLRPTRPPAISTIPADLRPSNAPPSTPKPKSSAKKPDASELLEAAEKLAKTSPGISVKPAKDIYGKTRADAITVTSRSDYFGGKPGTDSAHEPKCHVTRKISFKRLSDFIMKLGKQYPNMLRKGKPSDQGYWNLGMWVTTSWRNNVKIAE